MGDIFNGMKATTQRHRADMLAKANTDGWTRHTEWHFSRTFGGKRMEWWPSGGKAKYGNRMVYGHRNVNDLIARIKAKESA
jgi:hypothetical protein